MCNLQPSQFGVGLLPRCYSVPEVVLFNVWVLKIPLNLYIGY